MSVAKNLFKNTSWMMVSQALTGIFGFIWTILLARYLGVNEFGIYSFAVSFAAIMGFFIDLGLSPYMIRDVSRDNSLISSYMGKLIPLRVSLSLVTLLLSFIILIIMGKNQLTIIISLLFIIESIFIIMSSLYQGEFQAIGKIKYQTIGTIINTFLLLILILIGIYFNLGIIFIGVAYAVSYAIMLIYLIIEGNRKVAKPKLNIDYPFWIQSIKIGLPFALTTVFTIMYFSIDTIMLSFIKGDAATGIYNASYKIITILTTFFPVYQNVVFPLMSKMFTDSKDLLKLSFVKSIKYLLLIIVPISLGILLYSDSLVVLFYGNSYQISGEVMQILICTVPWLFVNGAATTLLNASNKEVSVTKIYLLAVFINISLNSFLIPFYSYNGAAIATVITEIIILILMIHVIRKTQYCPDKKIFKDISKIIIAGIIMFGALYYLNINMWIGFVAGCVVYSAVVLALKILDDDDKYLIKEIIH